MIIIITENLNSYIIIKKDEKMFPYTHADAKPWVQTQMGNNNLSKKIKSCNIYEMMGS